MHYTGKKDIYIELADYYQHLIEMGVYKPGSSLPSVREVSVGEKVNPNTVARAFQLLCERGYVVSIPKKGYFVIEQAQKDKEKLNKVLSSLLEEGYSKEDIQKALDSIEDKE